MSYIPIPIACSTVGALIGLWAGACVNLIPVTIGAGIGCGVGSVGCLLANKDNDEPQAITGAAKTASSPS